MIPILLTVGCILVGIWLGGKLLLHSKIISADTHQRHSKSIFFFFWWLIRTPFNFLSRKLFGSALTPNALLKRHRYPIAKFKSKFIEYFYFKILPVIAIFILLIGSYLIYRFFNGPVPRITESDLANWPALKNFLDNLDIQISYNLPGWLNMASWVILVLLIRFFRVKNWTGLALDAWVMSKSFKVLYCRAFKGKLTDLLLFDLIILSAIYLLITFGGNAFYPLLLLSVFLLVVYLLGLLMMVIWPVIISADKLTNENLFSWLIIIGIGFLILVLNVIFKH